MSLKSSLLYQFATLFYNKICIDKNNALENQNKIFKQLINSAKNTEFGKKYKFIDINNHNDFSESVPILDYEDFKPYIEKIKNGAENVLWKGKPIYLAKTSGTTSGIKYIPITKESINNHIKGARSALICYLATTKNTQFLNGKMIFLSGSPELDYSNKIPVGRLSGIVNHHIPNYLKKNQLPTFKTNCINNWENKLDNIVNETINQNMTLISGIPPWVQMYFEKLLQKSNKNNVKEIFKSFNLFIHGGVNFKPYKPIFEKYIGTKIDSIETYPASEGFIAFQEYQNEESLLLNTNSGIFYEFIEVTNYNNNIYKKITLNDVIINVNYVLLISNNAGLWSYNIGDTIKFLSINPYKIIVTGRIKHFISAFGEHVIVEEVEYAMNKAIEDLRISIKEFTVCPNIGINGNAYHEWFIEFENNDIDINILEKTLNDYLCKKNIYYNDLINGSILQILKIKKVRKNGFIDYMKSIGKLGEQNKVQRLSNDRILAEQLSNFLIK